jgi:pimeloyl-ACP methyl ester carboxylesterase
MSRQRSTLAQSQQIITLALLAASAAWLIGFRDRSLWLSAAGFMSIVVGYSGFLALQLVAQRWVNRCDPAPRAGLRMLVGAWVAEVLQAPRVFCWRQPFRWRVIPDRLSPVEQLRGRRGVVFVHGFICNRGFWTPWLRRLEGSGHAFVAVNLEPAFGSIDHYSQIIDQAVRAVSQASGVPPLLVCHSMGGLAARAWLRDFSSSTRIYRVVTIAAPHHGTWLARFSRFRNGRQMAIGSTWLRSLAACEPAVKDLFTCWYSNCDNVVFPVSTAMLPGADNRMVAGSAHVELAFHPRVMDATFALLHQL